MVREAVKTTFFSRTKSLQTWLPSHSRSWLCKLSIVQRPCLFPSSGPFRMPCLLQAGLQSNLQHFIWMVKRNCSSGVKKDLELGGRRLNKVSVSNPWVVVLVTKPKTYQHPLIRLSISVVIPPNLSFINKWVNKHSFKITGFITPTATILHIIYQPPTIRYGRCVKL